MMSEVSKKADVGVIVGRFQTPELHDPHKELISSVVGKHDRTIVILGLSPLKATWNNPMDFDARKSMILEDFPNVTIVYVKDVHDDLLWSANLDSIIVDLVGPTHTVMLYGGRDSFIQCYKGKFPTTELESTIIISASEIRRKISINSKRTKDFRAGVIWATQNRYPAAIPTVDIAIVDKNKHRILLGRKPHESQFRFPGGFVDPEKDDCVEAAACREAREETGLEISDVEYIGSLKVDDWRYRREKDKIITSIFVANYIFGAPVPGDDICELRWFDFPLTGFELVPEHRPLLREIWAYLGEMK